MKGYGREKPDIISTSFYADAFRSVMPDNNTTTNFITCALNSEEAIEDYLRNVDIEIDTTDIFRAASRKEPLYSYYNNKSNGYIIVGAKIRGNKLFGMYSNSGEGITTLSNAIIYSDKSLLAIDSGTSFATPDIAIKVYIAKAFWRYRGVTQFSSVMVKDKIIISSDLDDLYIGRYASGGQLNFEKLAQSYAPMLVDQDGNIKHIKFLEGKIALKSGAILIPLKDHLDITSLYFIKGKYYWYSQFLQKWVKVDIDSLELNVKIDDETIKITKSVFENQYQQITVF